MALPDENEKLLIQKLRERMQDELLHEYQRSDSFLIRWIRARGHELEHAETMLRNSMKWRKENNIDRILDEAPDEYFVKECPYFLNGVDRKNQPVLCINAADWNLTKIVEDGKMEEFIKFSNRFYERLAHTIRTYDSKRNPTSPPITQFTIIINHDKFSMMQIANLKAVQNILQLGMTYEAHYPEILDKAIFINTNYVFQALFVLLRPLLSSRTLKKFAVYGTNRMEWEPIIRDAIDESQIARQFGG